MLVLFLAFPLALSVSACSTPSAASTNTQNDTSAGETEDTVEPGTLEALEANVMKDVENSIFALQSEMETLAADIDYFDKYDDTPYKKWLDARSDIYEFWLDLRSAAIELT